MLDVDAAIIWRPVSAEWKSFATAARYSKPRSFSKDSFLSGFQEAAKKYYSVFVLYKLFWCFTPDTVTHTPVFSFVAS